MTPVNTEAQIRAALDDCAAEPVHMPGTIQPFGVLLACDMQSGLAQYVSANAVDLFSRDIVQILGQHLRDLLGPAVWHNVQNIASHSNFKEKRYFAGLSRQNDTEYSVHVSYGDGHYIVEIEDAAERPDAGPDILQEQSFLIEKIQSCADTDTLFDLSTRLLRHISGFDRVMVYKFDSDWNGEVLAEARQPSLPGFDGLRFPHWDIPEQARAIMARLPLRIISDIDQTPIPIVATSQDMPPIDISLAQLRGVSTIHMQYLRNMGTQATMTLSVVVDNTLWGMISFHHTRPRIVRPEIRHILCNAFLPVFCLKLSLLQNQEAIKLSERLDRLQSDIQTQLERNTTLPELLEAVGPTICQSLDIDGLAVTTGSQSYHFGRCPEQAILDALTAKLDENQDEYVITRSFLADLPELVHLANDVAGALVFAKSAGRCLFLFRRAIADTVAWAGHPEKTIEAVDGNMRLRPRGSFNRYLEQTHAHCKSWSPEDLNMARQLWPLLSAAERQAFLQDISRQQSLMIRELNHRVRNILALVKSVSESTRQSEGSLESYSQALEARIMSLAAAHDLVTGSSATSVSLRRMLEMETQPFDRTDRRRMRITGPDFTVGADYAPILALVLHELTTNAVKYGSLSNDTGEIHVDTAAAGNGMQITWTETGGPAVRAPQSLGFGATLIENALPYELDGQTKLEFLPAGLRATLVLPGSVLENVNDPDQNAPDPLTGQAPTGTSRTDVDLTHHSVLILEDNFIISMGLVADLETLGCQNVHAFRNIEDALEFLETATPDLALLDINLGQGRTSADVANALSQRGAPFAFVTGYGETSRLPQPLAQRPTLTKPITQDGLQLCIASLLDTKQARR